MGASTSIVTGEFMAPNPSVVTIARMRRHRIEQTRSYDIY